MTLTMNALRIPLARSDHLDVLRQNRKLAETAITVARLTTLLLTVTPLTEVLNIARSFSLFGNVSCLVLDTAPESKGFLIILG